MSSDSALNDVSFAVSTLKYNGANSDSLANVFSGVSTLIENSNPGLSEYEVLVGALLETIAAMVQLLSENGEVNYNLVQHYSDMVGRSMLEVMDK